MRLAEAAVGRLYHDISGSLGAVLNGLDLAKPSDGLADEAHAVAADAAREVAARLRLARAIWNLDAPLDVADIRQLAEGLPNRVRLDLDLSGLAPGALPPGLARLVLAALSMAAEALHGRGSVALSGDVAGTLIITIAGLRAAWPPDLPLMIADPQLCWSGLAARSLPVRLAVLLAREAGVVLTFLLSIAPAGTPPPLLLSPPG
jgi:hypothetical protein